MKKQLWMLLKKNGLQPLMYIIIYESETFLIVRNWLTGSTHHIWK